MSMNVNNNNQNINIVNLQSDKAVKKEQNISSNNVENGQEKMELALDAMAASNSAVVKSSFFNMVKKEYNPNGTIKSKTTPFVHKEYDEFGAIKTKEFPNGKKIGYDKNGFVEYRESSNGLKKEYRADRTLAAKEYPDGSKQFFDKKGWYVTKEILADGTEKGYRNGKLIYVDKKDVPENK